MQVPKLPLCAARWSQVNIDPHHSLELDLSVVLLIYIIIPCCLRCGKQASTIGGKR